VIILTRRIPDNWRFFDRTLGVPKYADASWQEMVSHWRKAGSIGLARPKLAPPSRWKFLRLKPNK
jgi:hypothetical protein